MTNPTPEKDERKDRAQRNQSLQELIAAMLTKIVVAKWDFLKASVLEVIRRAVPRPNGGCLI